MARLVHLTLALVVAAGSSAARAQTGAARSMSMTGVVKAVSASSLTVESGSREVVFAVSSSTRFIGKGRARDLVLRTPEEEMRRTIKTGDRVTVVYRQSRTAMNALQVRVVKQ
jgi:hypothetical protein